MQLYTLGLLSRHVTLLGVQNMAVKSLPAGLSQHVKLPHGTAVALLTSSQSSHSRYCGGSCWQLALPGGEGHRCE